MSRLSLITAIVVAVPVTLTAAPEPGTHAHYLVLTGKTDTPPPFPAVDFVYGPRETRGGAECLWWQLEARPEKKEGAEPAPPLFRLRALTRRDPLYPSGEGPGFERYILKIDSTGETHEYKNVHTSRALLPPWLDFARHFVPRMARGSGTQKGVPETAEYLGHVLTLQYAGSGVAWEPWEGANELALDPELLVGTGRNFRDKEERRLPQLPERTNYTYVPFTEGEYPVMIEAGINLFCVDERQFPWVRGKPVFHIRSAGKNLSYPADLYRSNYLGPVMFLDEPGIIMVGDKNIHNTLRYFSDAAAVLEKRVRESAGSTGHYGSRLLERELLQAGANLGDMRLAQHDYPAWETLFETAYYQIEAGLAGIVHEGRYQVAPFDEAAARFTGKARKHTAREMLQYHFSILRGGSRPFGKHWGTSIYGQCDPAISREAVTLAYDMGARYVWFWTSDHDHHMPWPEQLDLARALRDHAGKHRRPSIAGPPPTLDKAIVIPYGYFVSLENLWWVRVLDKEGKSDASKRYQRLVGRVLAEVQASLDAGESFDITVDGGSEPEGFRKVVRLSGD